MNTRILHYFAVVLLALCMFGLSMDAAEKGKKDTRSLSKVTTPSPVRTWLNINNISTQFTTDGIADIDASGNSGLVFPKGSRKTAAFCTGFLWGAKLTGDAQVHVGGSAYRTGLQCGKILSPGVAEDPNLNKNRIYRVRPDYTTADLSSEVSDEGGSQDEVRAQYKTDWTEWPWQEGAPYDDKNGNGVYDAGVDVPGVKGANQTIWFVANDLNSGLTTDLYGTQPLGIELQVTIWAYSQQGALGNMFFKKYIIINKGVKAAGADTLHEVYVSQWSDIDDGNSTDDFGGCDTTLSLGYVYNALNVDATYSPLPPPAIGFDFFQGPIVKDPTGVANYKGQKLTGYKNLPMTAFYYFARGDATVTDPTQGDPAGATQFYNFFQGKIGLTGAPFVDPNTNQPTTYVLNGDPQTGKGWIDGQLLPSGDRRIGLASGPFTMAPRDTQEIVVAEIAAGAIPGVDRLTAIGLLKFFDKAAQLAYDNNFQLPAPPPAPSTKLTEMDGAVLLNWSDDPTAVTSTETSNNGGFAFEGYNVYQLPSASSTLANAKRIATYDVVDGVGIIKDNAFDPATGAVVQKVVQLGQDLGISRFIKITGDAVHGGLPLVNGTKYYFAVTAYSFNPDPNVIPNNLENPLAIITAVPHSPNPGTRYQAAIGDTIKGLTHTGPSDGFAVALVIDPTRVNGNSYKVEFDTANGGTFWKLKNTTKNTIVLNNQTNQSGDANYYTFDGVQVIVSGPPNGMKDWTIPAGARRFTFAGADGFAMEGFFGAIGWAGGNWLGTSTVPAEKLHNVVLKLCATDSSGIVADPNDANYSMGYRYLRRATQPAGDPSFVPFIVNPTAGYAFQDFKKTMPLAAYDEETGKRLALGYLENNAGKVNGKSYGLVNGRYWPPSNLDSLSNTDANGAREWLFIFSTEYSTTQDPALAVDALNTPLPMMWFATVNRRNAVNFRAGDQFEILANHPNTSADAFVFTAPNVSNDPTLAKSDVGKINVFPNPYYGVNNQELNKYQRFVTFNHLPAKATIRVFNLAGVLVRTIEHNAATQFERWDLANTAGLPVASGLYIAYIDMGDLGLGTKILKLSIIQEQQVLDRF